MQRLPAVVLTAVAATLCSSMPLQPIPAPAHWTATWMTGNTDLGNPVQKALSARDNFVDYFDNQTLREIVHTSISGSAVRIRLTNKFGLKPVQIAAVYIGIQNHGASTVEGSNHPVTFAGQNTISIPEGAEALSDDVQLRVSAQQNLAISLYIPAATGPATAHQDALQTNYVSASGDFSKQLDGANFAKKVTSWYFLQEVDVLPLGDSSAIVALGDSITDGAASRPDANERWPDVLARRLLANPNHQNVSIVNAGIGGNRVLSSSPCFGENAIARLSRDVFSVSALNTVILFEGTNDIGQPDTPAEPDEAPCLATTHLSPENLIAGYQQIIVQAHARHLKIIGATILPYQGYSAWNEKAESTRVALNHWIKDTGAFDGVIDFSAILADRSNPAKLAPQFDSGDHLHPNSAGHAAMANAIDLTLLPKSASGK